MPIPIDDFHLRFKPINKLEEPNHQAVLKLVQDEVKHHGQCEPIKEIRTKNDVDQEYLSSKFLHLVP